MDKNKEAKKAQKKKEDLKNTIIGFAAIAIFAAWWMYEPEWEKQGYESEGIFEQALEGGFINRADFKAAQKYSIITKSEWDALNNSVSDGGFASIEAMREAAELGYSSQAAWDAALEQQAKEAGFFGVAMMKRANEQGYATQAEWDSAIERERIETILRSASDTLANLVACREMNIALMNRGASAIARAVGEKGLNRISRSYGLLLAEINNVLKPVNDLPADAREGFQEMWEAKYQSLTADFWDLDTTSQLTAYQSQCSMRVQMICERNKMRSRPDDLLKEECKRVGIR